MSNVTTLKIIKVMNIMKVVFTVGNIHH